MNEMSTIDHVDIDDSGVFKYVLIKVPHTEEEENDGFLSYNVYLRGYASCSFHADVVRKFRRQVGDAVPMECIGGGRIDKNNVLKTIKVYGYSQEFGQADHSKSVKLLEEKYPTFDIEYSNEGY